MQRHSRRLKNRFLSCFLPFFRAKSGAALFFHGEILCLPFRLPIFGLYAINYTRFPAFFQDRTARSFKKISSGIARGEKLRFDACRICRTAFHSAAQQRHIQKPACEPFAGRLDFFGGLGQTPAFSIGLSCPADALPQLFKARGQNII
ncbi:MAG: hypothetical protein ACI4I8_04715 [Oscillospiraceae bacterium]